MVDKGFHDIYANGSANKLITQVKHHKYIGNCLTSNRFDSIQMLTTQEVLIDHFCIMTNTTALQN